MPGTSIGSFSYIFSILQMRKLRLLDIEQLSQGMKFHPRDEILISKKYD